MQCLAFMNSHLLKEDFVVGGEPGPRPADQSPETGPETGNTSMETDNLGHRMADKIVRLDPPGRRMDPRAPFWDPRAPFWDPRAPFWDPLQWARVLLTFSGFSNHIANPDNMVITRLVNPITRLLTPITRLLTR